MKILVVGGGIAGTALGYFLQDSNKVTIVEKGPTWRTIGYAVGIWKNGLNILSKFPLSSDFWKSGSVVNQGAVLSRSRRLFQLSFYEIGEGAVAQTFEREILHEAIHGLLRNVEVRFNTSLQSIRQLDSGVEVEFDNGGKETFDLLVGADGLRSRTRSMIFGDKLKSYGWSIWGGWAPSNTQAFSGYHTLSEVDESLLSIPYHDKYAVGFIYKDGSGSWPKLPKNKEEFLKQFPLLRYHLDGMISDNEDFSKMFCDALQYVKMNEWYKDRVVLIGDARHGMSPFTGMGTSLALEDAFVLAEEIKKKRSLSETLENFSKRRNKRLKSINLFKYLFEVSSLLSSPLRKKIRDLILYIVPKSISKYILRQAINAKI